jgi:hypothetical protein
VDIGQVAGRSGINQSTGQGKLILQGSRIV